MEREREEGKSNRNHTKVIVRSSHNQKYWKVVQPLIHFLDLAYSQTLRLS